MLTVAEVRQRLVDGDLVSARSADDCVRRWVADHDEGDGDAFVSWLAGEDVLTPFQVSALQAGHAAPFLLGPYRVFDRLAHTEMGHVYRAVHAELDLPVSLKVFSSSLEQQPVLLARMQREARASVELDHPNVLRIFQVGRAGNIYFLASQNITGESLADWLVRDSRLAAVPASKVIRQAALGLQHLHEKCMVHRNVCPQNLWLNDSGAVKLVGLDWIRDTDGAFGIADPAASAAKTLVGSVSYLSPEQAEHPELADAGSDVYALGCVFYHCLTGNPPFPDHDSAAAVTGRTGDAPPVLDSAPETPPAIVKFVEGMLSKNPDNRCGLDELIAGLETQLDPAELDIAEADAIPAELLAWLESSGEEAGGGTTLFDGTDFTDWLAEE